ncbi:ATP-binding protein [Candidatus Manganitrophus noduliformans]|uniref:histidine kinase n=1 Tax=Candidatus Manganitrophus noduliformans TaxID=2606439 RepID=A0A7X6IAN6_9BACT|nr:ATP-binding protein [Candidatus Manganitrophus noduliformans]NKE70916.1 GAF domain-containing protein [Candidatus Manganitrophus noduliformans]
MNAYALSSFITFISVFFIGIGVFLHRPEERVNRQFVLFSTGIAVWAGGRVLYLTTPDEETALFWARVTIAGTVFIPSLFLHFVSAFLKIRNRWPILPSYAASLFLFVANLTPWMVQGVSIKHQSAYFVNPGPLYPLLLVLFSADLLAAFYLLQRRYRQTSGLEKNHIRLLFWSTLIGFAGGTTNFLPDFNMEIDSLSAYATYLIPLYVATLTYAIIRYRFLDIEIVIQKGVVYFLTLLITAIPFFLLTEFFQQVLPLHAANIASFLLFAVILLVFANIKPLTQQWVERSIFRERSRHYQSIHEFSRSVVQFLHLEDLTEKFFTTLVKTLHPTSISLFLSDGKENYRLHRTTGHEEGSVDVLILREHPLVKRLEQQNRILSLEELEWEEAALPLAQQMRDLRSILCIPLSFETRLIGICYLGQKENGQAYSQSELFMLQTLAANASVAFKNAQLFMEVSRYAEQFGAISQAINLSPDVDQIFDLLLREIQKYTPFDWASIAIYKEEGEVHFYRVKGREGNPLPENYTWPLTDLNLLSRLTLKQEPLLQADLFGEDVTESERKLARTGVRSYLILPLLVRGKLIGTLNLWSAKALERPAQALEFVVPLTYHLAPFLEVARLFEGMKRANEALRMKSIELEESQRRQTRFYSFITHELRTPLNSIIGYLSLILNGTYGPIESKQVFPMSRIKENANLLGQLINDLLDLARIESKEISLHLEEIELEQFVTKMAINLEPLFLEKGTELQVEIDYPGMLYCDSTRLRQIFQNLLSNAAKFTENGFVRISATEIPERNGVLIQISDSGIGISEDDLPHIFDPFWQGTSESQRTSKGSGLGLAIVKKSVEILKGEITVSSHPGQGTTFTLFLPRQYPGGQLKIA